MSFTIVSIKDLYVHRVEHGIQKIISSETLRKIQHLTDLQRSIRIITFLSKISKKRIFNFLVWYYFILFFGITVFHLDSF